ncbi:VWA domain-containing protein [Candidatus Berkelbacteria bacterium]|nr:VWA domain-containing protein [Candidatus Berkelbacteria bacterium]
MKRTFWLLVVAFLFGFSSLGSADWHLGFIHSHSTFSDGTRNPEQLVRQAKKSGAEFLFVTDHFEQIPQKEGKKGALFGDDFGFENYAERFRQAGLNQNLLVITGAEIATYWNGAASHALALGNLAFPDDQLASFQMQENTQQKVIDRLNEMGLLPVAAHPFLIAQKYQQWHGGISNLQFQISEARGLIGIEFFNDETFEGYERTMAWYLMLIGQGKKVVVIAGCDSHTPLLDVDDPNRWQRKTDVFCQQLSESSLLQSIKEGKTSALNLGVRLGKTSHIPGFEPLKVTKPVGLEIEILLPEKTKKELLVNIYRDGGKVSEGKINQGIKEALLTVLETVFLPGLHSYVLEIPEVLITSPFYFDVEDSSLNNAFAVMLDVSGSMGEEDKLTQAKRAASAFVDSLADSDQIALVDFSSTANLLLPLESLSASLRQTLKAKISQTEPLESTNIGDGLRLGLLEVRKDPTSNPKRGLLLSDGMHNEGELWPFVEEWKEAGFKVDCVAFGSDADRQQLTEIAARTNGKMFPADNGNLAHIWQTILAESRGQTLLLNVQDYVFGAVSYPVQVDAASQKITVFLDGQSSVELISPDGKVVTPKAVSGQNYGAFEVDNPLPGKWQVKTLGAGQLNLGVAVSSPLFVNFLPLEPTQPAGKAVRIGVEIKRNQGNALSSVPGLRSINLRIAKPKPDWLALVTGQKRPDLSLLLNTISPYEKLTLFDDGLHGDGQAGDGVFANAYRGADISGGYLLNVNLGLKLQGQQFNRQLFSSLQIGALTENPINFAQFLHHLVD